MTIIFYNDLSKITYKLFLGKLLVTHQDFILLEIINQRNKVFNDI